MTREYPFNVPESTLNAVESVLQIRPTEVLDLDRAILDESEPMFVGLIDSSQVKLSEMVSVLDLLGDELSRIEDRTAVRGAEKLLSIIQEAMETEIKRLRGIVTWTRLTWMHDPVIKGAFGVMDEYREEGESDIVIESMEDEDGGMPEIER